MAQDPGGAGEGPPTLLEPGARVAAPAMRPLSRHLSRRILGWAAAVAAIVGGAQATLAWQHTRAEFEETVRQIGRTHVPLLAAAVWDIEPARLRSQLDNLVQSREVAWARITTPLGQRVEASRETQAMPSEVRRFALAQPGRPEVAIGELEIAADPRALYRELLYNVLPTLLGCGLLTGLIAVQVRRVLRRELEEPLRKLADHVHALSPDRLSRPLVLQRSADHHRDEIDVLVEGFEVLKRSLDQRLQRGERDLERQLEVMTELLDALPNPIFVKGPGLAYTACNRAYEEAFGIDRHALVGRTVLDLAYHTEADRQRFHREDVELLERGGRAREEVAYRYADGTLRTVLRLRATLRLSDGSVGGLVGALVDISDRKGRERAEDLRRRMFERIARGVPLPELFDAMADGLQAEFEGSRCALLVADGGEAPTPSALRCHAPGWPALGECLASPAVARHVREHLPTDREVANALSAHPAWAPLADLAAREGLASCWFEPLRLASGELIGGLLAFGADSQRQGELDVFLMQSASRLTALAIERAEAARALEGKQIELLESQRQLKLTIDTMEDGFIRGRIDDSTDRVNGALVRMLGYGSRLEMLGRPTKDFYARLEDWEQLVREVMGKGFVRGMRCQARRKDGSTFWSEISAHPARDAKGQVSGVEGVVRDISVRIAAEQALQLARDEAKAASDAKGIFLANMSHEIRTPMNAVIGLTELTLRTELTTQQRGYLGKARSAADSLLEMLNDLLDLTKIESGRLDLERIAFDLSDVLDGAALLVAVPIEQKRLTLRMVRGDEVPARLMGDPLRTRQVLINLISNACKFSERGEIVVSTDRIGNPQDTPLWLRFVVTDPGIGMSPDQLGRLFQPFVQADGSTTRRFGGTGLGLAISHQLVQMMGGRMAVRSVLGEGSTFTVELPFAPVPSGGPRPGDAPTPHASRQVDLAALQRLRGARVLLVEDNAINRHVACELLQQAGLRVDVASDGELALQRLAEAALPYDCVLMDLQMPGMDGYTATRRLRENPAWAGLPVLAMTASVMAHDRQRVLEAGMNDHIAKPVLPADLYSALARWILPTRDAAGPDGPFPPPLGAETQAQAALPSSLPGIDLPRALAFVGGQPALLRRLLQDFLQDHADDALRVRAALAAGEPADARRIAHTLRSVAGSLGATSLQQAASRLDDALRDDAVPADLLAQEPLARTPGNARADARADALADVLADALGKALGEVLQGLREGLATTPGPQGPLPVAPLMPAVHAASAASAAEPAADPAAQAGDLPMLGRRLEEIDALLAEMDPESAARVEALLAAMPAPPPAAWQLAVDAASFDFEAARATLSALRAQLIPESP